LPRRREWGQRRFGKSSKERTGQSATVVLRNQNSLREKKSALGHENQVRHY